MRTYERFAARLYRGEAPRKGQPVQALAGGRTAPSGVAFAVCLSSAFASLGHDVAVWRACGVDACSA